MAGLKEKLRGMTPHLSGGKAEERDTAPKVRRQSRTTSRQLTCAPSELPSLAILNHQPRRVALDQHSFGVWRRNLGDSEDWRELFSWETPKKRHFK